MENGDNFRVFLSGLYHQITPLIYPVVEFTLWLREAYDECWDMFLSSQGNKIFSISLRIIRKALFFHTSSNYVSFNEMTLSRQFSKLPWRKQSDFVTAISYSDLTAFPSADSVPLSTFKEDLQPTLALIAGLLGVEGVERVSKECISMLWLMSQPGVVLDIPSFLAFTIQTQFQDPSDAARFRFCSMVSYLFLF